MVHDHGRAEDITQEVFMSALRRMRETERPIIFKPWVYEIAKNACIDAFRRSKRAEEVSYDAEEGLGGSDYGRLVSSTPTPDAAVDTRQSLDHLRGAFGGLSETHHDILVMRELEGLSYREIGRRLGMSRPSVESTLFRARRRLTEEYEELASGERCQRVQGLITDGAGRRMGIRDERKLARHVSYCQPCRRAAYAAGFDIAALAAKKSLGAKVAALLPFPAFVRRWFGGHGSDAGGSGASAGGSGSGGGSLPQWSSALGQHAEQVGGWAKAAAVAATVAAAGAGAGVATTQGDSGALAPPPAAAGAGAPASSVNAAAAAKAAAASAAVARSSGARSSSGSRSSAGRRAASRRRPRGGGSGAGGSAGGGSGATSGAGRGSAPAGGGAGAGASSASAPATTGGGAGNVVDRVTTAVPKVSAPKVTAPKVQLPKTGNSTVDQTTGAVTGAVNDAAGTVTDAANATTGTATGAVNGVTTTAGQVVTGATGTVTGVTSDPVGTVTGATSDPVGTVTGTVGGVLPGG